MKIIDLLNIISNEEFDKLPKKIKYRGCIFEKRCVIDYWCKETKICLDELIIMQSINDEIEILEEEKKIPEKLPDIRFENGKFYLPINDKQMYILREVDKVFLDKINEIIDYLKNKGE